METTAILDSNNVVINIIMADPTDVPGSVDGYGGAIGDTWDGVRFLRPEVPLTPLPERQTAAWERIKHERDRRKFAGVKVGPDWFHCDTGSRGQWERMVNRVNAQALADSAGYTIGGQPVPWKTMLGNFVVLTAGKIRAVVDAVELQEAMIFGRAEAHRVAMEASSTPETYDFSGGWPASFEDAAP